MKALRLAGALAGCVLVLTACPGKSPVVPETAPSSAGDDGTPVAAGGDQDGESPSANDGGDAGDDGDAVRPPPSPSWIDAERPNACELSCAVVHDCLLLGGDEPAAAASIELGCLGACVSAPARFARCDPGPVTADPAGHCEGFLACVREAWPRDGETDTPQVDPVVDGCTAACKRFAACEGADDTAAKKCGELCREALSPGSQDLIGQCAGLDDCVQVEMCIRSFPGA